MSENLENNDVALANSEELSVQTDTNTVEIESVSDEKSVDEKAEDINNHSDVGDNERNSEDFTNFLRDLAGKKSELDKEIDKKREYLAHNLAKYDTEDYFGNDSFKELYTEAFNSLGTNLDTAKFISLLDNYVNSRIE